MKITEQGERIKVSHSNDIDNLIYPASPPLLNKSQTYSNDKSSQEKPIGADDKFPQNAKRLNTDRTAVQIDDHTSRQQLPSITPTRQKSKQDIRRTLNALYSEAIGKDNWGCASPT